MTWGQRGERLFGYCDRDRRDFGLCDGVMIMAFWVAVTGDENDFFVAEAGRSVIALSKMLPKVRAAFE